MPFYKFECDRCGARVSDTMTFAEHDTYRARYPNGQPCDWHCNGRLLQVYNFHFARSMPEHYSPFLDAHVTSKLDYDRKSKIQQEEMSQRMGYDVEYVEVDPSDAKAIGVRGDAGLESQEEARFYEGDTLDAIDAELFDA